MGATAIKMGGSTKGLPVGRKRTRTPPDTLSDFERAWAEHLGRIIGGKSGDVADSIGVSHDAVLKWCAGESLPSPKHWPKLAAALNLRSVTKLFPAGW